METKLISRIILLLSLFISINNCSSQNKDDLKLENIKIDTVSLFEARYSLKNFGDIQNSKSWTEDYEDYSRKFTELIYDSIEVLYFNNSSGTKFINWIKVTGSNHSVFIKNNIFKVNNDVNKLKNTYPDIYNQYTKYLEKNKKKQELAYFGKAIIITNKFNKDETYNGSIKFGLLNGYIKEILIDLRTEGDFD